MSETRPATKLTTPKPPPVLNKETVGVWNGWGRMGDKEVAREAATKGLHVKLAVTFLSLRKNVELSEAQAWFNAEIVKWADELLERKQIFRASHILTNIGVEPASEFSRVFRSTCSEELREYVGGHLVKIGKLEDRLQQFWNFLKLILENAASISNYKLPADSIECLKSQTSEWKAEVAAILFLKTKDGKLGPFLKAEILWKNLLFSNNVKLLQSWINLKHRPDYREKNVDSRILEQFKKLPITDKMVNMPSTPETDNVICDELGKFGIFRKSEKGDFPVILERLKNSFSIGNLHQILSRPSSVMTVEEFMKLLIDYCLDNKLFSILNVCVRYFAIAPTDPHLSLILDFRALVRKFDEISLRNNIFNVSRVLSDNLSYFNENPVILLALILYTKDINFIDAILKKTSLVVNDVDLGEYVANLPRNLPILGAICDNQVEGAPKCRLTVYDLIEKHLKIDAEQLFRFRFVEEGHLPHFNSAEIVQNYGFSKKIDFKFYLKQSRPSTAADVLLSSRSDLYRFLGDEDLKVVERKVSKLAIANFSCDEITSGCVAFLELLKIDSLRLRVLIKAAKIFQGAEYDDDTVTLILLRSYDHPQVAQECLEGVLIKAVDSYGLLTGAELVHALKTYEILVQFSKLHNLKLPELLLKIYAGNNLWLPFLVVCQLFDYPLEQLKVLIQYFRSPSLAEHVTHSVLNDVFVEEVRGRDSRQHYLSKIGVKKSVEALGENLSHHSLASQSSGGSSTNSWDIFEIDVSNIKATLLQTLIWCHNSTDPPKALLQACQLYRNPLLAVFATSYEPDSITTNWLTWLAVSCELCHTFTNYESVAMSAGAVGALLESCMRKRCLRALLESFEIFLPDNPLKAFVEFLGCCVRFDFDQAHLISKLQTFASSLKIARRNSVLSETDREMTYLTNRTWIEATALRLLTAALDHNCNSLHEQILVVEVFHAVKIWSYFATECPNFRNLLEILRSLRESDSGVRLEIGAVFDAKTSRQAIVACINALLEKHCYETALKIARVENLPPDLILIKEWQNKFENRVDDGFWGDCDQVLSENNVTADCVVEFYVDCSENIVNSREKYLVLKLACDWASSFELSCQYELEKKMWVAFLYMDEKHRDLDGLGIKPTFCLYRELTELLKNVTEYEGELSMDCVRQLERVVSFALNKGNFWQALKLQKMFGCKSADLETLKLCHSLAEGILLPYELNVEQRLLLSNVNHLRAYSHRKTFLSTKFSSFSSSSHSIGNSSTLQTTSDGADSAVNDTLAMLKLLSEHLSSGAEIGHNIFMTYRISLNIEIPYHVVVATSDCMKMLKDALEDNCMNKLDVVHDFISVFKWNKNTIADLVCEELVVAITRYVQSNLDKLIMWDLDLDRNFPAVLQLFQENCSILGYKIYSYASTLYQAQIELTSDPKISDLSLVIELMIRAHDCFTSDCNMEGISVILKKSREVISHLLTLHDWKLIVRLLTGVGRYTEMNYVFHILMENDQFEYLLRKGSSKNNTLKVALLEYLKKYCPDNRDLYKIVALHFTLFSEVAMLWEREAQTVIRNLIAISKLEMQNNKLNPDTELFVIFQNTEGTRICLNKAMENYTHATEFHLQGEKLMKALSSAKKAELLALQISLLNESPAKPSSVCILELTETQISSLISAHLSFEQCLILVEAYDYHADWASVLYEQYVLRNSPIFMDTFMQHIPLTDTLVHDVARKFHSSSTKTAVQALCIRNMIEKIPSVHTKYRIASELGFSDIMEELLASGHLAYLKDTVWKKGNNS